MITMFALAVVIAQQESIVLWPEGNPGGWSRTEVESSTNNGGILRVANVSKPTLEYFAPTNDNKKDAAVIVCPGGGYNILAIEHEGTDIAKLLAKNGYHAFVLKYRLPRKGDVRYEAALQDAQRAVEIVRTHAAEWGISREKIGMIGFSAGGHLTAATAATNGEPTYQSNKESTALNFVGLIYPAYLVDRETGDIEPEISLLGAPVPTFIVQTTDDPIPVENSLGYYKHLKELKGECEMHIFPKGPHGYGLRATDKAVGAWPELLITWLDRVIL